MISTLPCDTALSAARLQSLPTTQWLLFDGAQPNSAPYGIPYLDWTDSDFAALRGRMRTCATGSTAPVVRLLPNLLNEVDRQQGIQTQLASVDRQRRDRLEALRSRSLTELRAIQQSQDPQDQLSRLQRLSMTVRELPDLAEQADRASDDARHQLATQQASAARSQRLLQAEQELRAAQAAADQEQAEAQHRHELAEAAAARQVALRQEQQAAAVQAAADDVRLAAISQQRAVLDARRREQSAQAAKDDEAIREAALAAAAPPIPASAPPQPAARPPNGVGMPVLSGATPRDQPAQQGMVSAVQAARTQFATAASEFAQGAARSTRARAICAILGGSTLVQDWNGQVSQLSSNSEGRGILRVDIGKGATVGTWDNALSDVLDNTLIDPKSPVFGQAQTLHEGQKVRFSGRFVASDTDCVEEMSLTLSGSIRDPEFVMAFTKVAPAD